ncbi:chemotaxis protein [Yersinia aleksiciae]|uniref:chemotaxis protein n=1 Tax=Yersinia aleksiciae TaxID=263819 RepID=UPI0011A10DF0|nr:chemotaxis protein [Yersinia aleksiciae]
MADKNNADGIPPQGEVVGTEIPKYKSTYSKLTPILRSAPSQTFKAYRLVGKGNIAITAASLGMGWLNGEADEAHEINVAAQNVSAPVEQFSQLSGAMRIRGADRISAIQSAEQLYQTFNNILWDRDKDAADLLQKYNVDIVKNENNTVNVPKTMENLAPVFKNEMDAQEQNAVINILGGNTEGISLLREGVELKDLLSAPSRYRLTVDPELITKLEELRLRTTEFGAAVDGIKQRVADTLSDALTFDNILANTIGGMTDLMTYGPDNFSIMHTLGMTSGYESQKLRQGYNSNDFYQQLNLYEKVMLDFGLMTDGYQRKYDAYYAPTSTASASTDSSPEQYVFNPDASDAWRNNRVKDLNSPDPYSLLPSSVISPASVDSTSNSVNASPIYAESTGGFNLSAIADVIATAMQNNRVQIELTLIDGRTGETAVIPGQGGSRISYAMDMPL